MTTDPPEPSKERKRINIFIGVFLVVQLILPISYYFSDTPADERYAWRMFSPQRVVKCRVAWYEGPTKRAFNTGRDVHVVWNTLMQRQRMSVVTAYAKRKCAAMQSLEANPALYMAMSCQKPGNTAFEPVYRGDVNLCEEAP